MQQCRLRPAHMQHPACVGCPTATLLRLHHHFPVHLVVCEWAQAVLCAVQTHNFNVSALERLLAWPSVGGTYEKTVRQEWDQVRVTDICIPCAMLAKALLCTSHLAGCR